MATLELIQLSKKYGKTVWGAKDVNLKVDNGEFVVFLGPSGCGKTTTLRMIAGLEEVTIGKIFIDGKDVTYLEPRKREVSMVFQSYAVWPHMTVYENIAFPLKLKKMSKSEVDIIVKEVSEMVKIKEYLNRYPRQLSGGQRQRVALARALAVKPKIFLMDEPLSNLDAKLRVKMRTELKAIHNQTGATTIFVTHDQSEALSMADRIVVMRDGHIEQVGTPDDVYFDSENIFVAGFIGTPPTNFFEMNINVEKGKVKFFNEHLEFYLPDKIKNILKDYNKNKIILGIRPESFEIVDEKDKSYFTEKVLVVEPQGSHQIIALKIGEQIVKIIAPSFPKYKPNDVINIGFDEDRIMLFDIDNKKRVRG
ncbi:carbohydrate ABC transporter ATP-binding protein, CUT1 family (TC 3.A.1.1.-) [Marinitoga hydrogenitolerans DSM 16785]|uniref:Carbohydrate ABC transporter ATP-binding protein, CUT1 family (TC 3.A.1.1.-) n=1 Tax=Marinitoga hydrogenitolerans (strain DSM 16785 / JCM 12826 / AT1271) TaxID=1122195 RepID=A0A1M4XYP0_MARH1|nr:ABC transporter ATP-binding protein [Marinitoga hydrogenitolerans]SHE98362.1 carbohydrate ABC transporter ATP-binding protein, CUT1 family (TC 3.A.1.1.-) [Marinitoga hydrogenitolerans DSM 16785]